MVSFPLALDEQGVFIITQVSGLQKSTGALKVVSFYNGFLQKQ